MNRLEQLIETLADDDDAVVAKAKKAIFGFGVSAIPILIRAVDHKNQQVVAQSVVLLGLFGQTAASAVPVLMELAVSDDDDLRTKAATALSHVAPHYQYSTPSLRLWLSKDNKPQPVLTTFQKSDNFAYKIIPTLLVALQDESEKMRELAFTKLNELNWIPVYIIPALFGLQSHGDVSVSQKAKKLIEKIRDAANGDVKHIFRTANKLVSYNQPTFAKCVNS